MMKKFFSILFVVFTLSSLIACQPGVYLSRDGQVGPVKNQNTTVMGEASLPTASTK